MNLIRKFSLILLFGLLPSGVVLGSTAVSPATPVLKLINPRGMQRGTETTLVFSGDRLFDAKEVFFYDEGVEVRKIEQVDGRKVKVTLYASPDCRVGEHLAQLRTATGVTEFQNFFVGTLEEVQESEPNSDFKNAQEIKFNQTVNGTILLEDVDAFRFQATKGQRISVEVEGVRLGYLLDSLIQVLDAEGKVLKTVDDSALLRQDACLSITAPADGDYVVMLRDSSFEGNGNARYRLHIGDFPRPVMAFPAGGKPGEKMEVTFYGDPAGDIKREIVVPKPTSIRAGLSYSDDLGISPSPVRFLFSELDNVFEAEPNNEFKDVKETLAVPLAFNGRLTAVDPCDLFRFSATKGQLLDIKCHAFAIGSELDSVVAVFDDKFQLKTSNDDAGGKRDSIVRFRVPHDGDFYIRIKDRLNRGGKFFTYRLEIDVVKPALTVGVKRTDRFTQRRQQIAIPQGNRFGVIMDVRRSDFKGQIKLIQNGLPKGVTMDCRPSSADSNIMPVVFSAAKDAPFGGGLYELNAADVDAKKDIRGDYLMQAYVTLGPPNNAVFHACDTKKVPVAVIDPVPFKLEMIAPQAPLVRSGSMSIKIVAQRDEGFDKSIFIQFPFRSPGVGTTHQIVIPKGKSEVNYPLNANRNAQLGKWPIYVIGFCEDRGRAWVSSQLCEMEVAEPRVEMQLARTSLKRGDSAEVVCNIDQLIKFDGEATAELLGMPPNIKTNSPLTFDSTTKTLTFKVETNEKSPAGKHTPFVQVTIPHGKDKMVSRAGKGVLIINAPKGKLKEKVAAAK